MQAIIFANRHGQELAPLNQYYNPALLPISNKSVIEYTLEDLASAGVKQVKLIVSTHIAAIKALVGNGEFWGLEVDYFLSREQEDASKVLARLAVDKTESVLVARGDMLRSPCIKAFVEFSQQMKQSLVIAKMNNQNAGLMMLPAAASHTEMLNWPLTNQVVIPSDASAVLNEPVTQILHGECFMLTSLNAYMQANQAMAIAKIIGISPKGRFYSSADQANGFYVGAKTKTGPLRMQNAWGVIGDNTWIDESVELQQSCILGKNCLVDAQSSLKNCIILDDSYVGKGLNVNNAIVCKNTLITPGNGGAIKLNDDSILAKNHTLANTESVTLCDRSIALFLLCIGLVFSPLIATYCLVNAKKNKLTKGLSIGKPLIKEKVTLNNKHYSCWRWNVKSLWISRLPQLYLVVLGRLSLIGRSPFIKPINPFSAYEYGIYGPLQLLIHSAVEDASATFPEEECDLIEDEFAQPLQKHKYWQLIKYVFNRSKQLRIHNQLEQN